MREIKFRLFKTWSPIINEQVQEMIYFDLNKLTESCFFIRELVIPSIKNKEVIMQYTGLRDKNGVEIYEGDILQDDYNEWYDYISYSNNKFDFTLSDMNLVDNLEDIRIIGNIYENPELLNEVI